MEFSACQPTDQPAMEALFRQTFADSEGKAEGELIGDLVHHLTTGFRAPALHGFVAKERQQIVGCILFSRLMFDSPEHAFLLSPVAVRTDQQGKGIGQQLIRHGLGRLRELGVELVFTYGDPNYYSKVGFRRVSPAVAAAPFELSHPEGWLGLRLDGGLIPPLQGRAHCVEPFNDPRYW